MQVSRGNILKTIGMLCNPNFIYSQLISIFVPTLICSSFVMHKGTSSKNPTYFLYPLTTFLDQEVHNSVEQSRFFAFKTMCWPPLFSMINIKGGHLPSCT